MIKKIMSLLLVVAILVVAIPQTAYACDCDCCCCKNKTSKTSLAKKSSAAIKPVKKYGKNYKWSAETKTMTKTSKKLLTKVTFRNSETRYSMIVYMKATKKNGKITTQWLYKKNGVWHNTNAELIKDTLKKYGYKSAAIK